MPLSLIAFHYESTAPASCPQLPREAGATAGFTICDLVIRAALVSTPPVIFTRILLEIKCYD
jgi:hypothetical protein